MKKSIFALLFLLILLVVSCVYQKTYTLYALTTTEEETLSTETPAEVIRPKEEPTHAKKQNLVEADTKVVTTAEKTASQEPTLLEKIKTNVAAVISSEKETPSLEVSTKIESHDETKPTTKTVERPTLDTKEEEKEVVDYLLSVLKERDVALANRDVAETKLQALIKQALENRRIAIENMDKASTEIDTSHQERLQQRDTTSQNNNVEKGK